MNTPEQRIAEHGIILPPVPKPVASYVPAVKTRDLAYTSGQLPFADGHLQCTGKLGLTVSVEQGRAAARTACLNALAALRQVIGTLDHVERIVQLLVYVHCADNFIEQPQVANGASELIHEIFGEHGQHTRIAVGSNVLPLNASVEVSLVAALRESAAK
jgi:enamine deaminase RidA (YjgF/YER057c/UK114 family)